MLKREFLGVIYNKRKLLIMIFFVFIICFDAWMAFQDSFIYEAMIHPEFNYDLDIVYESTRQPYAAAFLSSASLGHIPQKIIIWLLPIYFLIINCDSYVQERQLNCFPILQVRLKKSYIFIQQCLATFSIAFFISLIAVTLNFIICLFLFQNGARSPILGDHFISIISLQYPYLSYFVYMIIFSLVCGILAVSMKAMAYLLPYYIPLYVISFGIWFHQIGAYNSIAFLLQPYIEFGIDRIGPSILFFLGVSFIPIILGYIKLVKYEYL